MNQLELYQRQPLLFVRGACVAACNHPTTTLSVAQIEAQRAEPIDKATFTDCMGLYYERFDKEPNGSVMGYYFGEFGVSMGRSEFLAAFRDLMLADVFFAAGWAYLSEHVKNQRKNGPDLISLGMAEAYKRGAE